MLVDDFNSRKGQLDDTPKFNLSAILFTDSFVELVFQDVTIHPSSKKLHSMDQTINKYGRSLTNIYISHYLRLLNGRIQGDMLIGQFTCHKFNGASTTDYVILSQSLLEDVANFSVSPSSFFSFHCPIAFTLRTKVFLR